MSHGATAFAPASVGNIGVGFAIPVDYAQRVAQIATAEAELTDAAAVAHITEPI